MELGEALMWTVLGSDCTLYIYIYIYIYIYTVALLPNSRAWPHLIGLRDHIPSEKTHSVESSAWVIRPTQSIVSHNTQHSQETLKHASGGILTRNPSRGVAANRRLRLRSHRETSLRKVKVQKPQKRPCGYQEVKAPRFQDDRQGFQPFAQAAFTPQEIILVFISVRYWVDPRATVRPEELCKLKFPVTTSGIETATSRIVAQIPNQLRHLVPHLVYITYHYFKGLWFSASPNTEIHPCTTVLNSFSWLH
jgi:hypothetical protein